MKKSISTHIEAGTARAARGITLIELMIVVVIIGIIAAIAYPSYSGYTRQARRADAQIALLKLASEQERFYSDCNTYATSITAARDCLNGSFGLALSADSPDGYYQLAIAATPTTFTATATPTPGKAQASDADCTSLSINSVGKKTATGAKPASCWRK